MNFPFLDGDVPRSTSYGVYISQLVRFARVSKKIIGHYKKIGNNIDVCDRLHAWLFIQSRLTTLLTSLIARR